MCGIIGIIRKDGDVVKDIISSLKKLEYRGYDSAGLAIITDDEVKIEKAVGKIVNLEKNANHQKLEGKIGIGHTRWATHGKVSEVNSHPHFTQKVVLVHNGIIENYQEIKKDLSDKGYKFQTQTDTEVIAVLLTFFLDSGFSIENAFKNTLDELEGSYAIAALFVDEKDIIAFAKKGSPMMVGFDENKDLYVGSDMLALSQIATHGMYLEDGDCGFLKLDNEIQIFNQGNLVERKVVEINMDDNQITTDGYETFMIKEIMQQPLVLGGIVNHYIEINEKIAFNFPKFNFSLSGLKTINIVACGTSYYAGLTAAYYFEKYAGVNVNVHIASEFRYRDFCFERGGVFLFISQSGETADTVAALKYAKENGQHIVSLVNATKTTVEHLSDAVIYCHAGVEIGVASTKAFTAQLVILITFALRIGLKKGIISRTDGKELASVMLDLGAKVSSVLALKDGIQEISKKICNSKNMIFIGRNIGYGICLEGALKMKEISYIPSEAIAAGELKHGPIALIDKETPVIAVAMPDVLFNKVCSNIEEIMARDGKVILLSDKHGVKRFENNENHKLFESIQLPTVHHFIAPVLYSVVLQMLAYYVSIEKGNDVDKPRNLAKSVTVE
ncbi:MAG: hypothetical protein RL208_490 [Pseudomonadota bacterium]|jgi:glucosamine--fructose-6-phosphate aminotransferase (isomerizing)